VKLASLLNGRVKSPRETVAKSLEGDYCPEHLFALGQSLIGFRFYQKLMAEVDVELQLKMRDLPRAEGAPEQMPPRTEKCFYQRASNEPAFNLKAELFRIAGVDLTDITPEPRSYMRLHCFTCWMAELLAGSWNRALSFRACGRCRQAGFPARVFCDRVAEFVGPKG
jgi:hypothetical protein